MWREIWNLQNIIVIFFIFFFHHPNPLVNSPAINLVNVKKTVKAVWHCVCSKTSSQIHKGNGGKTSRSVSTSVTTAEINNYFMRSLKWIKKWRKKHTGKNLRCCTKEEKTQNSVHQVFIMLEMKTSVADKIKLHVFLMLMKIYFLSLLVAQNSRASLSFSLLSTQTIIFSRLTTMMTYTSQTNESECHFRIFYRVALFLTFFPSTS